MAIRRSIRSRARNWSGALGLLAALVAAQALAGDEEAAWQALPKYQAGQDMAPLLALDQAVIRAMATPAARNACAARLAKILESTDATPAARQYVCLQLRQVGTPAQVALLAKLLLQSDSTEMARVALESIAGDESLAALRAGLDKLSGAALVGVVNSLGVRRDAQAVPRLQTLAGDKDRTLAAAALRALGNIGDKSARECLLAYPDKSPPAEWSSALLRCAASAPAAEAQAIYERLSAVGQPPGVRRAALDGLFRAAGGAQKTNLRSWLAGDDPDRRLIAARHLGELSDDELATWTAQLAELPDAARFMLLDLVTVRQGKAALPLALATAKSDKLGLKLAGIRALGMIGDLETLPFLLEQLGGDAAVADAGRQALARLPRKEVAPALMAALGTHPAARGPIIAALKQMRCYEAIDALIELAAQDDPAVYELALDGLKGIADPDKHDIPRLVRLWRKVPEGRQREEVERTIVVVCGKLPAGADRAALTLNALKPFDATKTPECLPLLGRLGGPKVRAILEPCLKSENPAVRQAAIRGLCNWPTAEVADKLWELAAGGDRAALRAYVRVAGLKSDRPEAQTLAMFQKAMQQASEAEDRQLILVRAATVRTMPTVEWIATYLDDQSLAPAASQALVELAHHRFLRHPNLERFGPLLEKVEARTTDPELRARARRYRLGL